MTDPDLLVRAEQWLGCADDHDLDNAEVLIRALAQEVRDLRAKEKSNAAHVSNAEPDVPLVSNNRRAEQITAASDRVVLVDMVDVAAEAHLEAQTAALREYVQHKDNCGIWMTLDDGHRMVVPEAAGLPEYKCTCGLDALIARPTPNQIGEK